jgi:hypothetical protein
MTVALQNTFASLDFVGRKSFSTALRDELLIPTDLFAENVRA